MKINPPRNPYRGLPSRQFWSTAMTEPAPGHVDPVVRAARIEPGHKIATMGSCFAQHLGRQFAALGLQHFVAEAAPADMSPADALANSYGIFSARYGNVYTARQALQLFDRAFGQFHPQETVWAKDERFVDAFRPAVQPQGFADSTAVLAAAQAHLACVREVLTQCDWLVLTLGLTEAWCSRVDGAIYGVAPGVAGGSFDAQRHIFVNFEAHEVRDDLGLFVQRLASINPRARVLLTVSPQPLIATYLPQQVWTANTISKARLRVAADEVERAYPQCVYFPSYEVITSPAAGGRYYADDLRQVTTLGIEHVVRLFKRHFVDTVSGNDPLTTANLEPPAKNAMGLAAASLTGNHGACDEELIAQSLRDAGLA